MFRKPMIQAVMASPLALVLLLASNGLAQTTTTAPQVQAKAAEKVKKQATAPKLVDLNKATAEQMVEVLPGVGEVTAKKIVDGRPYAKIDDLAKAGIPARTIEGIRSLVTVSEAATKTAEARKTAPVARAKTKGAPTATPRASAKVNLNTATTEELETLPGIGPAYAKQIIALRPIKKLTDLENIKGLSTEKIEELDEHVVILTAEPKPQAQPTASAPTAKGKIAAKKAATTKATATDLAPGQKINLNKASQDDLQLLPGIGPIKSQAIIDARPFKSAEDVMKVKGIKEGSYAKIKDHISVE